MDTRDILYIIAAITIIILSKPVAWFFDQTGFNKLTVRKEWQSPEAIRAAFVLVGIVVILYVLGNLIEYSL